MRKCRNCARSTFDSAKFCHHCGAKMIAETLDCPNRHWENDLDANACINCNFEFYAQQESTTPKETIEAEPDPSPSYDTSQNTDDQVEKLDLNAKNDAPNDEAQDNPQPFHNIFDNNDNEHLESEILNQFADFFEQEIKIEHPKRLYNAYVDRFEHSEFKISFEYRVKQLSEQIKAIRKDGNALFRDEETLRQDTFQELLDYFVIRHCTDLNTFRLPEAILKYQHHTADEINLGELVLDYLDFAQEDERVYTDFIQMPLDKLKNASKSFLFPEKGEKIFFICDQSVLGSYKDGFAMTERAIYWKMPLENPERVYYRNLRTIEKQQEWLLINEMFLNINPSLNIKLLKLLKKLKRLQNTTR